MQRVQAYEVVEVEIEDDSSNRVTRLSRLLRTGVDAPELKQIASELQKPIIISHPTFGTLQYEREYGWYEGHVTWGGKEIRLTLNCKIIEDPQAILEVASRQFRYKIALGLLASGVWAAWCVHLQIQHAQLSRPLLEAVIAGDERSVKTLLDRGANPDAQIVINDTRSIWQLLGDWLHRRQPASIMGPPLLLTLLPQPIDENSKIDSVPDEQAGIVAALLEHGATPNVRDPDGTPILYLAYTYNHLQTAQLLLDAGAKTNARCANGSTAVSLAAAYGRPDWIQSLVLKGADVNMPDNDGWTPLMWVIRNHAGNAQVKPVEALRLLIQYGADVNKREKTGNTALGWTDFYAAGELADILKQFGAVQ